MSRIKGFWLDQQGAIAIIYAIAILPVLVAVGAVLDYNRAFSQRLALQSSTDAAVLAAAGAWRAKPKMTVAQLHDIAAANFATNSAAARFGSSETTAITLTTALESVKLSAVSHVPTTFMKLAGIQHIEVTAESEAPAPPFEAEVALLLDHSNSMTGSKQTAMINGVIDLFDRLTASGTNDRVKIGLVPFAGAVYASMPGEYALGGVVGATWTNCTRDRRAPHNMQETAPVVGNTATVWGRTDGNDTIDPGEYDICQRFADSNLQIRRLSTDHATTRQQITTFQTVGGTGTNILTGLQFGWQVLSPDGIWQDGDAYGNKPKIVILLSDGRQTASSFGPGGGYTLDNALVNIQTLCANMRAKGIIIATIAYEIADPSGKADLQTCASDSQYYVEGSEATVARVLESLGHRVMAGALRLTR